jgi:hypothetical protein
MTTYYVDPDDGGTNVGTEANPWQSLQDAISATGGSQITAGDTVKLISANTGGSDSTVDETPSSTIDWDNASSEGSAAGGYLDIIGVNSSGVEDGSRYVISGSSLGSGNLLECASGIDYIRVKNVRFTGAPADNFDCNSSGGNEYWIFDNCRFDTAGNYGFDLYQTSWCRFERCRFDNNTFDGISFGSYVGTMILEYCLFDDNTSRGCETANYTECCIAVGCIFVGNGNEALYLMSDTNYVLNCVFASSSGDGIAIDATNANQTVIQGCRFAYNGAYGIDLSAAACDIIEDYNVFYSNTSGHRNNIAVGPNSLTAASVAELGFTDHESATWNRDFNLTTDAILRSTAIELPD